MTVIVTLLLVLLNPDMTTRTITREFRGADAAQQCELLADDAHDVVKRSGSIDVGTVCVQSKFDDDVKPRA